MAPLVLQVEELRSLKQPARTLLEADLVFAAHQVNGHSRHAKIRLEDGRLCLYSLRDQPPPLGAAILQVGQALLSCSIAVLNTAVGIGWD